MQTQAKPTQTGRLEVRQPLKVVAIGDSLVYGYGDPVGGGWVEGLRRQWMGDYQSGHVLYNLGIRGDRVAQVSQRLAGEFRYRGELRNRVPDLIILSVGVNDSARLRQPDGRLFTEFEQFSQQISDLLDQAQKLCPVLFVGMVPVDEDKMPFLNCFYFNHFDQYRYKEAVKTACEARQIPYLDIFDLWLGQPATWRRSRLSDDGLHPNVLGYETLRQDILNWEPIAQLDW
ncbi:GDSL-type esterase/lipase family protein [Aphanothece sacrum]|uniref:Lipolytic protein G-D-S-L family n=1 Tax=Aphanothece sacrum FPU1 TaxID=1920663 RepID=A0A401IN45_APHSA|nr:GDSL-type esterase/lipase family protein [Aphanothece sacrum]GBF82665.1 lipolytic protein G-D-S-L family [Aphanothece sacrum FPU1]GBF84543.1 lipolytic protein G-D-S-L family [Aphanothece sacrum FPU3]